MEYGCIGEHLKHSFSKEIHALLADYDYEIKEIERENLPRFMEDREFRAINVTIPYKRAVIPYLYEISDTAKRIGAVNTVVNRGGKLYGYNTDFSGMRALILKNGIELKGKKVLILGSGGTSSTACAVAENLGASKVFRVSRSEKSGYITYGQMYESHTDAEIIINTTPVGMYPNISGAAADISKFSRLSGVVDAVYNPLRPEIVLKARAAGIKATGGLYMLVSQAAFAYEKFVGKVIDSCVIDKVYRKIMAQKENIVLIGMPSCGKSTIGEKIADSFSREFIDTDSVIVEKEGKPVTQIFSESGEEYFRKLEKEVIAEISAKSGCVIATGGGAVLNTDNIFKLRQNGRIYFIDRPIDKLITTPDRPLSSDREALERRYSERYGKYCSAADVKFTPSDDVDYNVKVILEDFSGDRI